VRTGLILLAVLTLGACGMGTRGTLPKEGIAGLTGTYRGEAVLSLGRTNCPAEVPYAITVRDGMAYGQAFNPRAPQTEIGRFEGLIDAEGKIGTKAWVGGDETLVEGYFTQDRFIGTTKSENCTNQLTLRRHQT
jgi:hypothetical protein